MLDVFPRPTFKILKKFYASSVNYKFFNDYIFPSSMEVRREKIFKPRIKDVVRLCQKNNIGTNNILEIGAGYGLFLGEMIKNGTFNNVIGLEASESLYERSNDMGFRVFNGIFEELEINEKFDVIVSFEVLEHIFNPKNFLKKIFGLLRGDGMLVMTFPNYNGFDISTLERVSDSVDHEHLNYFNEESIKSILKDIGFEKIDITTPGVMDVDLVRNKILDEKFKPEPFINDICINKYDEIGNEFQEFLISNKLSSNMMIVANKYIKIPNNST